MMWTLAWFCVVLATALFVTVMVALRASGNAQALWDIMQEHEANAKRGNYTCGCTICQEVRYRRRRGDYP